MFSETSYYIVILLQCCNCAKKYFCDITAIFLRYTGRDFIIKTLYLIMNILLIITNTKNCFKAKNNILNFDCVFSNNCDT